LLPRDRSWCRPPLLAGFIWASLILCSAPTLAQTSHQAAPPSKDPTTPHGVIALNPYEAALALKQGGKYEEAIKLLEPEAKWGRGYELAQLTLGQCYIGAAAKAATPEAAETARKTGLGWIVKAAEGGEARAQEELIHLSIEGGAFQVEPAEAGKWYLIWKRNANRYAAGISELDPKLADRLKKSLTDADWAEAKKRADAWKPT
jgi:hypothetical protein